MACDIFATNMIEFISKCNYNNPKWIQTEYLPHNVPIDNPEISFFVVYFGQVIRAMIIKQFKFCLPKIQGLNHPD